MMPCNNGDSALRQPLPPAVCMVLFLLAARRTPPPSALISPPALTTTTPAVSTLPAEIGPYNKQSNHRQVAGPARAGLGAIPPAVESAVSFAALVLPRDSTLRLAIAAHLLPSSAISPAG